MEMQLAVNALVIETEIEQEQEFTQVEIKLPTPYSKVKIKFGHRIKHGGSHGYSKRGCL